jgi:hypothetical protein
MPTITFRQTVLLLILAIVSAFNATSLFAQAAFDRATQQEVSDRLKAIKAIYEQGAFRSPPFRGVWVDDGGSYRLEGGEKWFSAATGELLDPQPSDASSKRERGRRRMHSPNGKSRR